MRPETKTFWQCLAAAAIAIVVTLAFALPPALALPLTALVTLLPLLHLVLRTRHAPQDAAAQTFLQQVIDLIPEPVYVKDARSRYVMANQALARELGRSTAELIGKLPEDLVHAQLAAVIHTEDIRIIGGAEVIKEEHDTHPLSGQERYLKVIKRRVVAPDGTPVIIGTNVNITARRLAERELSDALERETRLREHTQDFVQRLIDVIPDPVYVKDSERHYLMVNEAFARERGRPKEEILGLTSYDLAPSKEVGDIAAQEDAAVLAGGEVNKEEHARLPISGDECYRIVTKRRCINADGKPVVVGAHFYITRYKIAERELQAALQRETERRKRTLAYIQRLIDVIPQPVYVKAADSRLLMINDAYSRDRKLPPEEIVGRYPHELAPSEEHARMVVEEDHEVLAGKVVYKEEQDRQPVTNLERFRIISKRACEDAEGNPVIVGANFNVTSWRIAERELKTALETQSRTRGFLQSVFDALPTPLFVADFQGRYLMVNRSLARLFGLPTDTLVGRQLGELPDSAISRALQRQTPMMAMPAGQIRDSEFMLEDIGRARYFMMREVQSVGLDSQPVCIGVLTDVSSLRETEARWLMAKETAEQASAAKSIFLANMSHEIRTPLSGVIGTMRLALRDQNLTGNTLEYLRTSLSNAESLLAIINDILDFSKIEAGELKIEEIDFDLGKLVRDALQVFRENAADKSLVFSVNIDARLPAWLRGDPTRVRQVLVNLVGNAVKFTKEGSIIVSVRREDSPKASIVFSVRDTGIGIPADAMPRLFEKFQQADNTTTRRFGGTGLGLAICRELVEAMDGYISVNSQLGEGSVFEFRLPLREGSIPPEAAEPTLPRHSHRLSILCAEDVAVNQLIVRAQVEQMGHQIDVVETGMAALRALSRQHYDLVLLDGRMPELDGMDAARAIREGGMGELQVRDPSVMIVALTANANTESRQQYLDAGMDVFLTKPVEERALHKVITQAIARQRVRGITLPPLADETPAPRPANSTHPDIDDSVLEAARSVFLRSIPDTVAALDSATHQGDHDALARLLHNLKSSAGYFPESGIQAQAATLEMAARSGDMATLASGCSSLRAALQDFLEKHQPA